jgi:hypothetical protein
MSRDTISLLSVNAPLNIFKNCDPKMPSILQYIGSGAYDYVVKALVALMTWILVAQIAFEYPWPSLFM